MYNNSLQPPGAVAAAKEEQQQLSCVFKGRTAEVLERILSGCGTRRHILFGPENCSIYDIIVQKAHTGKKLFGGGSQAVPPLHVVYLIFDFKRLFYDPVCAIILVSFKKKPTPPLSLNVVAASSLLTCNFI